MTLLQLLKTVIEKNASDLHLVSGFPPFFRVDGQMIRAKSKNLSAIEVRNLCFNLLNEDQKQELEKEKNIKFSVKIKDISRFRAFLFYQRGNIAGTFRRLTEIPNLETLNMPQALNKIKKIPSGLVIVNGPSGSGKSTTIASIVNEINRERRCSIVTLENPIEYIHKQEKSLVIQKEVGRDIKDLKHGLLQSMEQDCNVCVMGELRDTETIEIVLNLCESGHLVFATLSLKTAQRAINHLISIFSSEHQWRIRNQLSENLNAVINQRLIRSLDKGRVPAVEVMILNTTIKNLIKEDKLEKIHQLMKKSDDSLHLCTMNQSLMNLVIKRKIDLQNAFEATDHPSELDEMLKKVGI